MKAYRDIDEYIGSFPKNIQALLQTMRKTIKAAAPNASEDVKYGVPTFRLKGNLVHFGAFKNHVSFFPGSSPIEVFKKELVKYQTARGTIRFPLDKALPLGLIKKITRYRVKENLGKSPRP